MSDRRVVVTGIGTVSPFGFGTSTFWDHLVAGRSAASMITAFDVSHLPTKFAAPVPADEKMLDMLIEDKKSLKTMSRAAKFAVIAAKEAVEDACLDSGGLNPYRVGTSIGGGGLGLMDLDYSLQTQKIIFDAIGMEQGAALNPATIWKNTLARVHPLTPLRGLSNIVTAHIAIQYNARGNCQTLATACTSSAQAIGEAYRQIKFGVADVLFAGGTDSMVNPNGLISFSALGVTSRNNEAYQTAARPFDRRRDGFMIGEGATLFILEELTHCRRRGAQPYAEIIGYASTCDAYRLTESPEEAWGSAEAMRLALEDARLNPEEVDYINAHGTGTPSNDRAETYAIKEAFGAHAKRIPVSSTKSMIGHLVAASGTIEFAASVLALTNKTIPPTINYQEPDPLCDLDYVPNQAREAALNVVLSNSFGFGGQNACLVAKKIV